MDEDEDSRLFLKMLDDAAERIFIEACSEVRAEETSEVYVECNTETRQPSLRKLCSEWSLLNTMAPLSQGSSSPIESQQRRKRPRTAVQQQQFPALKISLSSDEKALPSIVWPQYFTTHGFGVGKSVHVLESKEGLSLGKSSDQPVWKTDFRLQRNPNNAVSGECYGDGTLPWAVLPPMARLDGKSETEDTAKSDDDFPREIHDAIGRIEFLIPSLQKLVTSVQTPIDQKNVRSLELQNVYSSSTLGDAPVNVPEEAKFWEIARNELDDAGKISEGFTKVVQLPRGGKSLTSLAGNQHPRLKQVHQAKGNANFKRKEFEGSNERFNEAMTEIGATCLSAERDYCSVKSEGIKIGKSQVRGQIAQARIDRVESLRRKSGRNESAVTISSRTPELVSGLRRYIPCQCSKKAISKQAALQAHGVSKYQTSDSSVGSSSFRRPKTSSKFDSSNYKGCHSHAKERVMHYRESARRNSLRRKSINSASRNMITLHNQISEETSSFASTSGTSSQESGYPTSLSRSYQSSDGHYSSTESDETVEGYRKLHHDQSPRRKWSGSSSVSYTVYEISSNYSRQDQYSDTGAWSQRSSDQPHRREHYHLEEGPKVGRISKIGKKLRKIFHHHHHHHHHHHNYSDRDEPDVVHSSFFSRLGKMFQPTDKSDGKRLKAEKSHEPVSKIVAKKKQHGSHFRTLVDGLARHMKHSKKTKKGKDDIGRLAGGRHNGKRAKQKLPLWPKMGKGKAKLPNKGKVKFGTKTRRPQFAAAKMILR